MKTPILETERLILRPISLDDAPDIQKHINNWNIIRYITAPWPYPDGAALGHIEATLSDVEKGNQISWVITLKETNKLIGRIDYCDLLEESPKRGFWLAEPFQGQGYMTESVISTQDYMFFEYGLEKITVSNIKSNQGSRRVKEKTGARFLGEKVEAVRGKEHTLDVWEVTRENWAKTRGRKI